MTCEDARCQEVGSSVQVGCGIRRGRLKGLRCLGEGKGSLDKGCG